MKQHAEIRASQERALESLTLAHGRIQSARERDPDLCRGFSRYGGVRAELDKARALLERRTYRVALAGMMSAGKSTLANALLRRPGLLPTGIEETTLTITVVTAPEPGGGEGLTVHYLTREEALRGVFERGHFLKFFPRATVEQIKRDTPPEVLRNAIGALVSDGELPDDVREQLSGFLEALETREHLLGSTIHPSLDERRLYLAPRTHRDVGHLLLIAKAEIHVENDLFSREGLEFVDLPGADSTNERQQRIAYDYLKDTDLLVAVPNAAGFRFVDIDVLARFREARGHIRDRVFFVLNRFDEAKVGELDTADASLAYVKKIVDMLSRDYDPGNLCFTVGLWASLEERRRDGGLAREDERELERARTAAIELADHFERQGVLERIERDWNERYAGRIAEAIRALRDAGGVDRLRARLVAYLKDELELARLREVQAHLTSAHERIEELVEPERGRVKGFLDSAREQLKATGGFLQQIAYHTRAALEAAHAEMARKEGETEGYGFQVLMRRLSAQFGQAVHGVLAQDNDLIDFRALARETRVASPELIMQRVIDKARVVLNAKLVDMLTGRLAPEFAKRYEDALRPLENERALREFGRVIERPELAERYVARLEELERQLHLVTRLRALEETWAVNATDFNPSPGARSFEEIEPRFRQALIEELQAVYAERFRVLAGVLLSHYRVVLDDFLQDVEEITTEALREARLVGARVPVELLVARASADERRRYGLAEVVNVADEASQAVREAVAALNGNA